ncbi:MAG: fructosamine kinase family protein, partial [Gammaproteobacteria bacterium]|nr:fructosamine kinase family protein [Gammaproteobacteria bacterium]
MSFWDVISKQISITTGVDFVYAEQHAVGGGCINNTQKLQSQDGRQYFVKINNAGLLSMFEAEAEGLQELADSNTLKVPQVVCTGIAESQSYIVMENLQLAGKGSMETFAQQLAQMHRYTKKQFGWQRDNTIGSTPQQNNWTN